jgi:hypothetical protein
VISDLGCDLKLARSNLPLQPTHTNPPAAPKQYCDLGSLRHALAAGMFHRRIPAAAAAAAGAPAEPLAAATAAAAAATAANPASVVAVDMGAVVDVALEVAEAVAYLHSIRLCHCDIKVGFGFGFRARSYVRLQT